MPAPTKPGRCMSRIRETAPEATVSARKGQPAGLSRTRPAPVAAPRPPSSVARTSPLERRLSWSRAKRRKPQPPRATMAPIVAMGQAPATEKPTAAVATPRAPRAVPGRPRTKAGVRSLKKGRAARPRLAAMSSPPVTAKPAVTRGQPSRAPGSRATIALAKRPRNGCCGCCSSGPCGPPGGVGGVALRQGPLPKSCCAGAPIESWPAGWAWYCSPEAAESVMPAAEAMAARDGTATASP